MPRPRTRENAGLPRRWRRRYNAYYYQVPIDERSRWDGKAEFRLGTSLSEAMRVYAERIEVNVHTVRTVSELADRYEFEHVSQLKPTTRAGYGTSLRRLRIVFGTRHVTAVTPQLARSYFDHCRQKHSIASARHDIAVLRGLLTFALELGVIATHPLRGMRFPTVPPATTDVADSEIDALLALPAKTRTVTVAQLYMRMKLMTGTQARRPPADSGVRHRRRDGNRRHARQDGRNERRGAPVQLVGRAARNSRRRARGRNRSRRRHWRSGGERRTVVTPRAALPR